MRVVIVGASGNAGTCVLRALASTPSISSVLGIARRLPDPNAEPYHHAEWRAIDIAAHTSREQAVAELTEAFAGADAIIHLAWLIQPNQDRDLLRRVNVDGTRHVVEAAVAAGVPHLVVASSVGAYSPDPVKGIRDESWPTRGISSSHYSVDKAAQERVLDHAEAAHPGLTIARIRPGLIFHEDAGSQIQRFFLSPVLPVQLLGHGRPPLLPLPRGIALQAVHGEDLGRAYALAVVHRASGAFNVCADDILGPRDLAEIVDHGRYVELPPGLVRAAASLAYSARLAAADPGWLDMGLAVPLMDNTRARRELGWEPRHSAADAVTAVLEGMVRGEGTDSPSLRPRGTAEHEV